jgi:hypothetical protein
MFVAMGGSEAPQGGWQWPSHILDRLSRTEEHLVTSWWACIVQSTLLEFAKRHWMLGGIGASLLWFLAGKESKHNIGPLWRGVGGAILLVVWGWAIAEQEWLGLIGGIVVLCIEVYWITRARQGESASVVQLNTPIPGWVWQNRKICSLAEGFGFPARVDVCAVQGGIGERVQATGASPAC